MTCARRPAKNTCGHPSNGCAGSAARAFHPVTKRWRKWTLAEHTLSHTKVTMSPLVPDTLGLPRAHVESGLVRIWTYGLPGKTSMCLRPRSTTQHRCQA